MTADEMRPQRIHSVTYHDVLSSDGRTSSGFTGRDAFHYKLDLDVFRHHLDAITAAVDEAGVSRGETVPDLSLRGDGSDLMAPVEAALLHFDDGGSSALNVAPILEDAGWLGHFHIATDWIGEPGFLDRSDIRALHESGHVIGSHSASHPPRLSHCDPDRREREWRESVTMLSEITGEPVRVGSVPGGFNSRSVADAARGAGIRFLFDSEPSSEVRSSGDCLVLGRYPVRRSTSPAHAAGLASGDTFAQLTERIRWNVLRTLKRVGGERWLELRGSLLERRWIDDEEQREHPAPGTDYRETPSRRDTGK